MSRLDRFWGGPAWGAIANAIWKLAVKQADRERARAAAKASQS